MQLYVMELSQKAKDIIAKAPQWNLEGDCTLLQWMKEISQHLEERATKTSKSLQGLTLDVNRTAISLDNATNNLTALQHNQFVENRCRDDDDILHTNSSIPVEMTKPAKSSNADILNAFLRNNVKVLQTCHEKYALQFDDFDGGRAEPNYVYQQKNPYNERLLPHIYGSKLWKENWHVGLCDEVTREVAGDTASETYSEMSSTQLKHQQPQQQQQIEQNDSNSLHSAWESINSIEIPANNLKINNASSLQDSERGLFSNLSQTPPEIDTFSTEPDLFSSMEHIPPPPIPISTQIPPTILKEKPKVLHIPDTRTNNTSKNDTHKTSVSLVQDNNFKAVISDIVERVSKKDKTPLPAVRKTSIPQNSEKLIDTPRQQMPTKTMPTQSNTPKPKVVNLFDSPPDSPIHNKKFLSSPTAPTTFEDHTPKVEVPNTTKEIRTSNKFNAKNLFDDDDDDDDDFLRAFSNKTVKPVAKIVRTNLFEDDNEEDIFSSAFAKKTDINVTETAKTTANHFLEKEPPPLDEPKVKLDQDRTKIGNVSEKLSKTVKNDFEEEKNLVHGNKFKNPLTSTNIGNEERYNISTEPLANTDRSLSKPIVSDSLFFGNVEKDPTAALESYGKSELFESEPEIPITLNKSSVKPNSTQLKVSLFEDDESDEDNGLFSNSKPTNTINVKEKNTKLDDLFNDELKSDIKEKETLAVVTNENIVDLGLKLPSDKTEPKKISLFEDFKETKNDIFNTFEDTVVTKTLEASKETNKKPEDLLYNNSLTATKVVEDFTKPFDFTEKYENEISETTENYENQYSSVSEDIATTDKKTNENKIHLYSSIFSDEPPPDDDDDFSIIPNSNLTNKMQRKTNEDARVQDFYESPIPRSEIIGEAVKSPSQDLDYGSLHLFSDIPPDDDFEDNENIKTASRRLKGIIDGNSNLPKVDTDNSTLKALKSIDVTDEVMPPKPEGIKQIAKLQMPEIKINVQALLPNAGGMSIIKASLEKQQIEKESLTQQASITEISKAVADEDSSKLFHMCKGRVRLPANRRPSTRRARHASYQQSLLETTTDSKPQLNIENPVIIEQKIDSTKISMPPPMDNSSVILQNEIPPPLMTDDQKTTEKVRSTNNVVKKREFRNIFLDDEDDNDDDLFFNTSTSVIKPKPLQPQLAEKVLPNQKATEYSAKSMLFADPDNSESDNLVGKIKKEEFSQKTTSQKQQEPKTKSLFSDDENESDDDDLFKSIKPFPSALIKPTSKPVAVAAEKKQKAKKDTSLFGSSDEDDGFFNSSNSSLSISNLKAKNLQKTQKLFNDDFNIGDNDDDDDDDLFSSTKSTNKIKTYKPLSTNPSTSSKSVEIKKQSSLSDNPLADLL